MVQGQSGDMLATKPVQTRDEGPLTGDGDGSLCGGGVGGVLVDEGGWALLYVSMGYHVSAPREGTRTGQ